MKPLLILVFSAIIHSIAAIPPEHRADYIDDTTRSPREIRTISKELFTSLEELSRIVDITYCVGTTGVYKPFICAGRCHEFEGFELVTVSKSMELQRNIRYYRKVYAVPYLLLHIYLATTR